MTQGFGLPFNSEKARWWKLLIAMFPAFATNAQ
jgi:hypothetical protein